MSGDLLSDLSLRGIGAAAFALWTMETWTWAYWAVWCGVILLALEVLAQLVLLFGQAVTDKRIKKTGKHLDILEWKDLAFICFNKFTTTIFTYHFIQWAWASDRVLWEPTDATVMNTVVPFVTFFVVYDFFYTIFHWALHIRGIYGYVHKHHHRQMVPTRGNLDAVNVHPFEFVTGEYDHLLSMWLVSLVFPIHILTGLVFVVVGGFLASLNHTRFDVKFPILPAVYQVDYHDIHHFSPLTNYGQYTMLWDRAFGTFRDREAVTKRKGAKKKE